MRCCLRSVAVLGASLGVEPGVLERCRLLAWCDVLYALCALRLRRALLRDCSAQSLVAHGTETELLLLDAALDATDGLAGQLQRAAALQRVVAQWRAVAQRCAVATRLHDPTA